MANHRATLTFRDSEDRVGKVAFFCVDGTAANAIANDMQPVTNARGLKVNGFADGAFSTPAGPTVAQYASCGDKAVLIFTDVSGATHKYQVPAPKEAGFDSGNQRIVVNSGAMGTLITAILGNATAENGDAMAVFAKGHRSFRISRKQS